MKAIIHDTYGSPDVLEFRDIDRPSPGEGDVLVRVAAAGVDPGVWHLTTGMPYLLRLMGFGLRTPKVRVRGRDVAGTVEAVGAAVTGFRPGDKVFGISEGTFAEYTCAPSDRFVVMPSGLSFEEAAAIPISALTALQAVRDAGRITAGQRVLVIGAAGGVGSFAVQLAKSAGAHVTGVCSTGKVDLVRSLGADEVVDYTCSGLGSGYDVILDTAGNRPLSVLRRALTSRGTLVIVGSEGGGLWLGGIDRVLRASLLSPFVAQRLVGLFSRERLVDLEFLRSLVDGGSLRVVLDRVFPLASAGAAVAYVHEGHSAGKVVVVV